ncbi:hypothetical protein GE09DRAFT_1286201 [Coniochaeta sp. 2T2.1]|nr:hypothetical protein GE09DRAFT_1286201 [Coniochaeta sp. 2T2.1]
MVNGFNPRIRTQDMIPNVSQARQRFSFELSKHSKFMIVMGKDNFQTVSKCFVDSTSKDEAVKISINHPGLDRLFGHDLHLLAVRDKETKVIRQLITLCYHSQTCVYPGRIEQAEYADELWNAVCEWAGVEVLDPCAFQKTRCSRNGYRRTPEPKKPPVTSGSVRSTDGTKSGFKHKLFLAIDKCREEEEGEVQFSREQALEAFGVTIAKYPEWWTTAKHIRNVSLPRLVMRLFQSISLATSDAYRETKAWTKRLNNLAHGSNLALRRTNMAKGHETMKAEAFLGSDANARRLAGGAKVVEVRMSESWQSSEAAERQQAGRNKGVQTRKTEEYLQSEAHLRQVAGINSSALITRSGRPCPQALTCPKVP